MSKKKATKTKRPAAAGAKTKTAPAEKWTAYFHAKASDMKEGEGVVNHYDIPQVDCILLLRGETSREQRDRIGDLHLAHLPGTQPEWFAEQGIVSAETFMVFMDGKKQVQLLTHDPMPTKLGVSA
jgi:hypothetical protein